MRLYLAIFLLVQLSVLSQSHRLPNRPHRHPHSRPVGVVPQRPRPRSLPLKQRPKFKPPPAALPNEPRLAVKQPRSASGPLPKPSAEALEAIKAKAAASAAAAKAAAERRKYQLPPYVAPSPAYLAAQAAAAKRRALNVHTNRVAGGRALKRGQHPQKGFSGFLSHIAKRFEANLPARPRLRTKKLRRPAHPKNSHPAALNTRRKFNKVPNAPSFFYKKAEDMPGYQKFTLSEVIHTDKKVDDAEKRSDDSKEDVLKYVDSPKGEEVVKEKKVEEEGEVKKEQKKEKKVVKEEPEKEEETT